MNHAQRAHSKFSASGSERWLKCAASVELEEQSPPSPDSPWSLEGTKAHEVLEKFLIQNDWSNLILELHQNDFAVDSSMIEHCKKTAVKIIKLAKLWSAPLLVEKRVYNTFIHEDMFGTCDVIIPVHNDTLYIVDFKYGQGHIVDPTENTQLIQYALGAAESYDWQFKDVSMGIMQPRAGANWHKTWTITIDELKDKWLPLWHKGVARVEHGGNKPFAGGHCHWCRAKSICPVKVDKRLNEITEMFKDNPLTKGKTNGEKIENKKESGNQESFKAQAREKSKGQTRSNPFETKGKSQKEKSEAEAEAEDFY
jgi:Protein of unknown function (DUF2800)